MKLERIETHEPFTFKWWSGTTEPYDVCHVYAIHNAPAGLTDGNISVALGWRAAFGRRRRRVLVFRGATHVLAEFVGTDDWNETRHVAWIIKQPGGQRNAVERDAIPDAFLAFDIDRFSEWITGPRTRRSYAVRVPEDDHDSLVRIALHREVHKSQKPPAITDASDLDDDIVARPPPVRCDLGQGTPAAHVVRMLASYAREYLDEHLFAYISEYTGHDVASREHAYAALATSQASLSMLLGYYAFARQGGERAGYNQVCVGLLAPYRGTDGDRFWSEYPEWGAFYDAFAAGCADRDIGENKKLNRGLLRDVYELAANDRATGLFHTWVDRVRADGRLDALHRELMDVHGIGNKIAAFICRDLVLLGDLEAALPIDQRRYCQPIDVWVGRVAEYLNPALTFGGDPWYRIADFLAGACAQVDVSGVSFNQGAWYFGSKVATSATRLVTLLDDARGDPT